MFEAGHIFREIAEAVNVSERSLKDWAKKDGWVKGASARELHLIEKKAIEKAAEKSGLTKVLVADAVVKLINAKNVLHKSANGTSIFALPEGTMVQRDEETGEVKAEVLGVDFSLIDDRASMIAGAKLGAAILGMNKPQEPESAGSAILAWVRGQQ